MVDERALLLKSVVVGFREHYCIDVVNASVNLKYLNRAVFVVKGEVLVFPNLLDLDATRGKPVFDEIVKISRHDGPTAKIAKQIVVSVRPSVAAQSRLEEQKQGILLCVQQVIQFWNRERGQFTGAKLLLDVHCLIVFFELVEQLNEEFGPTGQPGRDRKTCAYKRSDGVFPQICD